MPLGKRINAIQKRLAVFEIADNDDNLKQSGARKDGDLSDSPRVALDKTLHCSLSYSTEDILQTVEPSHTLKQAAELFVIRMYQGYISSPPVKPENPGIFMSCLNISACIAGSSLVGAFFVILLRNKFRMSSICGVGK